jgi:hypothetical protein
MNLKKDAYTPEALVAAGYEPQSVKTWIADGARAVPQRARLSVTGRKRTLQPTTHYVWGPDVMGFLGSSIPVTVK